MNREIDHNLEISLQVANIIIELVKSDVSWGIKASDNLIPDISNEELCDLDQNISSNLKKIKIAEKYVNEYSNNSFLKKKIKLLVQEAFFITEANIEDVKEVFKENNALVLSNICDNISGISHIPLEELFSIAMRFNKKVGEVVSDYSDYRFNSDHIGFAYTTDFFIAANNHVDTLTSILVNNVHERKNIINDRLLQLHLQKGYILKSEAMAQALYKHSAPVILGEFFNNVANENRSHDISNDDLSESFYLRNAPTIAQLSLHMAIPKYSSLN